MGEPIQTLGQARRVINNLQRRADKNWKESMRAKAHYFDLLSEGKPLPEMAELKAEVMSLRNSIKEVVKDRDKYKQLSYAHSAENRGLKDELRRVTQSPIH